MSIVNIDKFMLESHSDSMCPDLPIKSELLRDLNVIRKSMGNKAYDEFRGNLDVMFDDYSSHGYSLGFKAGVKHLLELIS